MSPSASRSLPSMSSCLTTAVGAERFERFEALVFVEARERFLVVAAGVDEEGEQVGRERGMMWVEEVVDVGGGGGGGDGDGGDGGDEGEV